MTKYLLIILFMLFRVCVYTQPNTINDSNKVYAKKYERKSHPLDSNFNLLKCHFSKGADFSNTIINDINFSADTIDGSNFNQIQIEGEANFQNTNFKENCNFWYSTFSKNANFIGSIFYTDAYFPHSVFNIGSFPNVTFNKRALFEYSTFKEADFTKAVFKEADFKYCTFNDVVNFENVRFQGVSFTNAKFSKRCNLNELVTNDSMEIGFYQAILPDTLDFSNNHNLKNIVDFTNANFRDSTRFDYRKHLIRPVYIFLYNTDINKIKIDYRRFKLYFDSIDIGQNNKHALSRTDTETIYKNLLENFKSNKDEKSYRLLYKEYRDFNIKNPIYRWLFDTFYDYTRRIKLMVATTLIVWVIFSIINTIGWKWFDYKFLNKEVYTLSLYAPIKSNVVEQILWNLYYSLIYTAIIFFNPLLKLEFLKFKKVGGFIWILSIYLIGLLLLWWILHYLIRF